MGKTVFEKILDDHLKEGKKVVGEDIRIEMDQTLTQDSTGTLVYLEFEAMNIPRVKTSTSVSYVDHNTLQADYKNPDDHKYLQTAAQKYGIHFSRPGNGICHQLHLERFARPGKTLVGSDSHTTTAGGVGMLAIGMGGLDVASAMAGVPLSFRFPEVVGVRLVGELRDWVSAKDVILELLRRVGVEGGVGKVFEYFGPGVKTLDVPSRATITNMGAETGATTSIFPSDEQTKEWLKAQQRENQWRELKSDRDADYDEVIEIDLTKIEPMIALPHSPGNVKKVSEIEGMEIDQVAIGSCTNSSLRDMKTVANILEGSNVDERISLLVNSGSRQVVNHLVETGEYEYLVDAGARILENACGPCIGMGGAPPSNSKTVRTFNRNFEGRSGTSDAEIYLVSPEVAAVAAVEGRVIDPREFGEAPEIDMPKRFNVNNSMILDPLPLEEAEQVEVERGPNIQPLPDFPPVSKEIRGKVLLKVGDDITTDHIMPAGAEVLPLRSNIPEISRHVFKGVDESFYDRAVSNNGGFLVGGENYGQGSSREHAAIAPKYLGIKAVLAKSFSRIHRTNLINFGIVPLTGKTENIGRDDELDIVLGEPSDPEAHVTNTSKNIELKFNKDFTDREIKILNKGGLLPFIRDKNKE